MTHTETQPESSSLSPWFFIGRLIRFSGWLYVLNVVFWVAVYAWPLIPGYVSKLFFDALEQENPVWNGIPYTVQGIIAVVIIVAVMQVGTIFAGVGFNTPWRFRTSGLLRLNMMAHILARPAAKAVPGTIGEALNTLRDDAREAEDAGDWTLDVLGQTAYMLIAIAVLLSIDAQLTLFVFLPLVGVTIISYRFRRGLETLQIKARETSSRYSSLLGEVFQSVQAIQVAGAEHDVLTQLEVRSRARSNAMLRNVALNQALGVFSSNIVAIGTGLILLLAGSKMRSGEFTVGEFSLFVLYLWEVGHHTEFFGNFVAMVRRAGVAFTRMLGLMRDTNENPISSDEPSSTPDSSQTNTNTSLSHELVRFQTINLRTDPPALQPVPITPADRLDRLQVRDLRYVHPESGRGLERASFDLRRGEFVVVTGRIGSGKTTLVRALLGLLPAQAGEVRWNDQVIQDLATFMTPPRTAYTPQVPALISGSLRENILLGTNDAHLERAIHRAVLERDVNALPHGLETLVGVRGLKLSGGQLQRTAAARMFAHQPSLLVFDDISSALDVSTERELWQRLEPGTTALVVSHRRTALERADRIVLLEHGVITHTGTLEALLEASGEMRAIWSGELNEAT